jgi:thioredoxin 1
MYLRPDATPTRQEVDASTGLLVLEFGTDWCGICRAAQPRIAAVRSRYPEVRHIKIEDGPGRKLGRSFGVKLWPSLVFLRDGVVVRQFARPTDAELEDGFASLVRERGD